MKLYKKRQQRQVAQESQHLHYPAPMLYGFYGPKTDQDEIKVCKYEQHDAGDCDSSYIFHSCI